MSRGRHRKPQPRRAARAAGTVLLAVGAAAVSSAWTGASADAPVKYGWWSATNAGAPIAAPPPPDVPSNGLYVENGFAGPTAIAAVSFLVPTGATAGNLTLKVAGNAIMTAPPIACVITPAARGYKAAEDGSWADKPAYDCSKGQVKGTESSDSKSVSFAVAPLVQNGALAVAIVASGQADRIPFDQPDASALAVTAPVSTPTAGGSGTTTGGGAYGGSTGGSTTASGAHPSAVTAPAPPSGASVTTMTPQTSAGLPPAVAPQQTGKGSGAPSSLAGARPAAVQSDAGTRHDIATGIGLAAVVGALLFWTEGFGILGGRVASLAGRRRPAPAYPDGGEVSAPEPAAAQS